MNLLDALIISLMALNMLLGYSLGLVRRLVAFAGLFAGLGAATLTRAHTSTYVANQFSFESALWAHVATYAGIVVGAVLLFEVLGAIYQRHINMIVTPLADSMTGLLAGAGLGALEVALLLILGIGLVNASMPPGYPYPPNFLGAQQLYVGSLLASHFYGLEPLTRSIFALVLPSDVGGYFTQLLIK